MSDNANWWLNNTSMNISLHSTIYFPSLEKIPISSNIFQNKFQSQLLYKMFVDSTSDKVENYMAVDIIHPWNHFY